MVNLNQITKKPLMKKLHILMIGVILLSLGACKKDKYQEVGDYPEMDSQTATIASWTYSAPSYYGDISNSAITQDVLDNGAVLVYLNASNNNWNQLPLTIYTSSSFSSTLQVSNSLGNVRIFWTDSDLTQPSTPPSLTFKVVVLTPKILSENPDLDLNNYEEVKSLINKSN